MPLIKVTDTTRAADVRHELKQLGFTDTVSIRRFNPPFGGGHYFSVDLPIPEGVSVISCGGSTGPTRYGSSDGGAHARRIGELSTLLKRIQFS